MEKNLVRGLIIPFAFCVSACATVGPDNSIELDARQHITSLKGDVYVPQATITGDIVNSTAGSTASIAASAVPGSPERAGAAEEAEGLDAGGAAWRVEADRTTVNTSSRVIRPPSPVPTTFARSTPTSRAKRRIAGPAAIGSADDAATGAAGGAAGAGGGVGAA